jgi:hypothetical protein
MKQIMTISCLLAILAFALFSSSARANSLPSGTGYVQCSTKTGIITDATSCNSSNDSGVVTYAPFAGVSGSANGQGLVDVASVFGVLNYSFEVIGGNPGDVVPVDVDAVLDAISNSIGVVFSEITVAADTSAGVTICSSGCGVGDGETNFIGALKVDALSGTLYTNAIHLEIEAGGARGASYNGGTASADPYIFISPTFQNAGEYSIEVSPNIGNVPASAVPEPSTWAMMLLGFAGLGWAAYRRANPNRGPALGIA